ncbi:LysR substrate-binding domain-containing protein [Rhodoferax sediminis]|jgi:DNA-binding transcriptional LysR family regulator|uniref:LysR family transcriptional regulator n=1 Tax=Rhodoferax sediminis TaxID=2509614 RepID=A0A515DCC7_9BURK|nr:LysR substrate-binding domain-containing protein [Rhodoferax sediminis]QDL38074.1 LysR family transcriptional regulator [Rhodoferax sediminis]
MRDLDLTTLRLFVTVCETRNIARAGEQANIVGSAISKRLAVLEDTAGTRLLVRRRRGVEPTPAGETLLEHARAMLASASRIERDMSAYASGIRGQVRILATASVLAESLAEDVAAFLQNPQYRDIRVDMEEDVSVGVVRRIREGSASLGICWDAADFQGLQSRRYRADQLAVVVHPAHPLAALDTLRFEQALGYEHVSLPAASAVQVMLQRAATRMGQPLVQRVVVSNFDAVLRVVCANLAISVVPVQVAHPYAVTFGLRVIPLTDDWARRRFAMCFRDETTLSPAARLLVEHLARCGERQL